jgi:hypothetical protein
MFFFQFNWSITFNNKYLNWLMFYLQLTQYNWHSATDTVQLAQCNWHSATDTLQLTQCNWHTATDTVQLTQYIYSK